MTLAKGRRVMLAGALALAGLPPSARAQGQQFRIGLLSRSSPTSPDTSQVWAKFFGGLRELGYAEGRNLVVEGRFYGDEVERAVVFAAELARLAVDVIVAGVPPAPEVARRATSTIPIVMTSHGDPVGAGLVASLARPGGNVTGLSSVGPEMRAKQLQLLKEALPGLSRVAVLFEDALGYARRRAALDDAARSLNLRLQVVQVRSPGEFAAAFSAATNERAGALVIYGGSMFFAHRARLAQLALEARLPSIDAQRPYAEAGGLLTYGADAGDSFRRAATYVDRILKGAKPGNLPIEQPTKFELIVNQKTARALGLTLPRSLLLRADEVIE